MVENQIVVYDAPIWTVYMHINTINQKKYIGITSKSDIQRRWRYGKGYYSMIMGGAIKKYGWGNFSHYILLTGLTKVMAGIMERTLITYYNTHVSNNQGYNYQYGGYTGNLGMKQHPEAIAKVSGANNYKAHKVICLNTRKKYDTIIMAEQDTGVNRNVISEACRGNSKHGGFDQDGSPLFWVYYNDYTRMTEQEIQNKMNEQILTTNSHPVICLNNQRIFDRVDDASEYASAQVSGIIRCCQTHFNRQTDHPRYHCGKDPITNEWLSWMYLEDFRNLSESEQKEKLNVKRNTKSNIWHKSVICLNSLQVLNSISDISKYSTLKNPSNVRVACNNIRKYSGRNLATNEPLHWMYYDDYEKLPDSEKESIKSKYYTGNKLVMEEGCL